MYLCAYYFDTRKYNNPSTFLMAKIFSVFFILWLGNCVHFAIDVVEEILILFENVYDIYGDIQGASNSFKIHAYEQGEKTYM